MRNVKAEVEALTRLDLFQLRDRWEREYGRAPRFRSVELFRLMLAWRMQADANGGVDPATRKALRSRGSIVPEGYDLGQGAILRRQWNGTEIKVEVGPDGFVWQGRTFKSLSAVASAITGSRWNGPKFFGLRS